ncbi:hypothetical protein TNCV_3941151 [Trichonephila clavipes]|uniref:Uncharacterized protein n=1 Tax=Trichonephila clavipes TaxID=2585209 RepID=A0A8X6VVQ9_TRICX|nr:hypothetical protein TNCV_3941151 [Trichonephila clavipes]
MPKRFLLRHETIGEESAWQHASGLILVRCGDKLSRLLTNRGLTRQQTHAFVTLRFTKIDPSSDHFLFLVISPRHLQSWDL